MDELALHPTVKPVAMVADAIKDVSKRNGIVLDAFGGSGSTLIAAHKTGRRARLIELDPLYVDRIVRRWQAYANDDAVLAETGECFDRSDHARSPRAQGGAHRWLKAPDLKRRMPATSFPTSYEVGYRKPPKETRFRPGQSGNPRGRPKGPRSSLPRLNEERMKSVIMEEAYRTIKVRDGNRMIGMPVVQAILRSLALSAAKGHQRSQRLFTDIVRLVEREDKALHDGWLQTAIEYKIDWENELERRERLGIEAPAPIPHPDDIIIDMNTGAVRMKGPFTKEEKPAWDKLRARKKECDLAIADMRRLLEEMPNNRFILEDIQHEERLRNMISRVIPD